MVTNSQPVYSVNSACIVSLNVNPKVENLSIKPNPAEDQIEISGDLQNIETVNVYDIWGKPAITNHLNYEMVINVSHFTSGLYFCHIKLKNGKTFIKKFVKI
jgi:hypothetical protein